MSGATLEQLRRKAGLAPSRTEDGWEYRYWTEQNIGFFYREDGEALTFRAAHKGTGIWVPLVPVVVETAGHRVEKIAYLDSGTTKTYVPPSVLDGTGITPDTLSFGGTLNGNERWRECPGRVFLFDGTPMLEDGFGVLEFEPMRNVHEWGAAYILGLDVFQRFDIRFQWERAATDGALPQNAPTFSFSCVGPGPANSQSKPGH